MQAGDNWGVLQGFGTAACVQRRRWGTSTSVEQCFRGSFEARYGTGRRGAGDAGRCFRGSRAMRRGAGRGRAAGRRCAVRRTEPMHTDTTHQGSDFQLNGGSRIQNRPGRGTKLWGPKIEGFHTGRFSRAGVKNLDARPSSLT